MGYVIFDIGGSAVKYAFGTAEGELRQKGSFPTCKDDFEILLQNLAAVYGKYDRMGSIEGIAVSAPGFVDDRSGIISGVSGVPCIHGFPLTEVLSERFGKVIVAVENDGNCGILGEVWKGAARGEKSAAMVVCGSGFGGGFFHEGRLLKGSHHSASEFGFMPLAYDGERTCPWSDYSVVNLVKQYNRAMGTDLDGEGLFLAAETDGMAAGYVNTFYHYLAAGCMSVAFALDPDVLVIGGAVSRRKDFKTRFDRELERMILGRKPLGAYQTRFFVSELGNDANLYGALYHMLKYREENGI